MRTLFILFIIITALMTSFVSCGAYAAKTPIPKDSSHLGPIDLFADPGRGFVISRGTHQMYCGGNVGGYFGCTFSISNTQCPYGFTPQVIFAERWNDYEGWCALRGYFLDDPRPYPNSWGGYSVNFRKAYANFILCDDRNITVSYTVMCIRNY